MKTNIHLAAMNKCIEQIHYAKQSIHYQQFTKARAQLNVALSSFTLAVSAIAKNEISGVINSVETELRQYSSGLRLMKEKQLDGVMDTVILIKGRKEFR